MYKRQLLGCRRENDGIEATDCIVLRVTADMLLSPTHLNPVSSIVDRPTRSNTDNRLRLCDIDVTHLTVFKDRYGEPYMTSMFSKIYI